jgi:putative acetyltransferase
MSVTTEAALRPMLPADVPVLAAIFQAAIDELAADDYDEGQRNAWASVADDEIAFGAKLRAALTLVATVGGAPVGFIALEGQTKIDMLYVYPAAARRGIAGLLIGAIEALATARGTKDLEVDASDTARPFFEMKGYEPILRQTVMLGDHWFGNTRMRKTLGPAKAE